MVSGSSIIAMMATLLLALVFPVALAVWFYLRERYAPSALVVGVAGMTLSQFVIRIPLLQRAAPSAWFKALASNTLAYALFLGLTAGIFEEVARYVGFRFFLKNRLEWKNGIAYGLGHGGIEAILLVGVTYINNLVFSFMINSGTFDSRVTPSLAPGLAQYVKASLSSTAPFTFLLAGIERVLALTIQVALSLVVLYSLTAKRPVYLLYAILLHALVDTPAVILTKYVQNPLVIEAYVLLLAAIGFAFILRSRRVFKSQTPQS